MRTFVLSTVLALCLAHQASCQTPNTFANDAIFPLSQTLRSIGTLLPDVANSDPSRVHYSDLRETINEGLPRFADGWDDPANGLFNSQGRNFGTLGTNFQPRIGVPTSLHSATASGAHGDSDLAFCVRGDLGQFSTYTVHMVQPDTQSNSAKTIDYDSRKFDTWQETHDSKYQINVHMPSWLSEQIAQRSVASDNNNSSSYRSPALLAGSAGNSPNALSQISKFVNRAGRQNSYRLFQSSGTQQVYSCTLVTQIDGRRQDDAGAYIRRAIVFTLKPAGQNGPAFGLQATPGGAGRSFDRLGVSWGSAKSRGGLWQNHSYQDGQNYGLLVLDQGIQLSPSSSLIFGWSRLDTAGVNASQTLLAASRRLNTRDAMSYGFVSQNGSASPFISFARSAKAGREFSIALGAPNTMQTIAPVTLRFVSGF